jgi:hypothetical protein
VFYQKHLHSIQIPHIQLFITDENLLNNTKKKKNNQTRVSDMNIYYSNSKKEKETLLIEKKIFDDYF